MRPLLCRVISSVVALLLSGVPAGEAHEDAEHLGPGIRLQFLPPPMQGTISLGIYDAEKKLVRVLHSEATEAAFVAALDGLVTVWDGKSDAGDELPPGRYRARGYVVGDLGIAGEAFHLNDWIESGEAPRIRRIQTITSAPSSSDGIVLEVELADGSAATAICDRSGKLASLTPATPRPQEAQTQPDAGIRVVAESAGRQLGVSAGKLHVREDGTWRQIEVAGLQTAVHACWGRDDQFWVIDRREDGTEVKEYSLAGEFQRRLAIDPKEPVPQQVVATSADDAIFLLEEDAEVQRVRALVLVSSKQPKGAEGENQATSLWKVAFSKKIMRADDFAAALPKLAKLRKGLGTPDTSTTVRLVPNPLDPKADRSLAVTLRHDASGSILVDRDGLPLRRVSATPHLRWAVMTRQTGSKTVTILQSDGAVVEEYAAGRLPNMMAFDCGEFDHPAPAAPPAAVDQPQ